MQYWLNAFTKNYANFSGRARRQEFWMYFLFQAVIIIVLNVIARSVTPVGYVYDLYLLATLVPTLAIGARRLHDTGKSGWLQLIALTGIGYIVLIVFWAGAGNAGPNAHGADPKAAEPAMA
jgi:uncharacterized membrane protein YhaH (DUF805 family)